MKKTIIVLLSLLAIGCRTTIEQDYPSEIRGLCKQARDDAKNCIKSCNFDPKIEKSIKVVEIPGQKWYSNSQCWSWWSPSLNMWVSGLYWKDRIEIGRNPNLNDSNHQVNYANLKHEFGHYWLYPNGVPNHDRRFYGCFVKWNDVNNGVVSYYTTNGLVDVIQP